jgi:hypothetical protein
MQTKEGRQHGSWPMMELQPEDMLKEKHDEAMDFASG